MLVQISGRRPAMFRPSWTWSIVSPVWCAETLPAIACLGSCRITSWASENMRRASCRSLASREPIRRVSHDLRSISDFRVCLFCGTREASISSDTLGLFCHLHVVQRPAHTHISREERDERTDAQLDAGECPGRTRRICSSRRSIFPVISSCTRQ